MPKLAIRCGETLDREIELSDRDLRIGRGDQNDVVLVDETKAVSRFHAELRHDSGRYTLIDLNSQNGIWAGGRRQQKITLVPGMPVTVGTYTLVLQGEVLAAGQPKPSDTLVQVAEKRSSVGAPPRPKPAAAAKGMSPRPGQAGSSPGPIAYLARLPRPMLFGGFALIIIMIMALGQIFAPPDTKGPSRTNDPVETPEPAGPSNAVLKQQHLTAAQGFIDQRDFDNATKELDQVFLMDQNDPDAVELRTKVNELKTVPQSPPGGTPTTAPPPTEPIGEPNDTQQPKPPRPPIKSPQQLAHEREIADRYARARSALDTGSFQGAAVLLAEIERDEPGYKDVASLLARAREAARAAGQQALEAATKLEGTGDWVAALQQYQRAAQIDPSTADVAEESSRRLKARMKTEGSDAFTRARQYDAVGRIPEAVALYERAFRYLSDDDPNKKTAKDRLDALRNR